MSQMKRYVFSKKSDESDEKVCFFRKVRWVRWKGMFFYGGAAGGSSGAWTRNPPRRLSNSIIFLSRRLSTLFTLLIFENFCTFFNCTFILWIFLLIGAITDKKVRWIHFQNFVGTMLICSDSGTSGIQSHSLEVITHSSSFLTMHIQGTSVNITDLVSFPSWGVPCRDTRIPYMGLIFYNKMK